jgi:flagellar hook-associated protein 3 FlgL
MPVGTVGTYQAVQSVLNNVSTVETSLTNAQEQLSSGNAYQSFAQMGGQSLQFLSLSDTISRTDQYLTDHQTVEANVNTTSHILTQVITSATNLQALIAQRINNVDTQGFSSEVNAAWQQLVGQLNTNVGGQYLFSGSSINTPAVNNTNFPTLQTQGVPDAGYYNGNSQGLTTRVDDNTVITYNVNAGQLPFQQIFAGLAMAKLGDASNSTTDLQQAETLIQQGIAGVVTLQATVGATAQQLTTSDTNLSNQKLYLQGLQQSIGNTDIVSVSTQVAVNQGILQAAFEAFAKITSLQLSNYLK